MLEAEEKRWAETKVLGLVLRQRENELLLAIVDSEDEEDLLATTLTVDLEYSNHDHSKRVLRVRAESLIPPLQYAQD